MTDTTTRWRVTFDHDTMDCTGYAQESDDAPSPMLGPTRYCFPGRPCFFAVDVLAPNPPRAIREAQAQCQRFKDDIAALLKEIDNALERDRRMTR